MSELEPPGVYFPNEVKHPFLKKALDRWYNLMTTWQGWDDWSHERNTPPWAFGERALVSVLSSAVWLEGGTAMCERASTKRRRRKKRSKKFRGWRDMGFRHEQGQPYALEAKLLEPCLLHVKKDIAKAKKVMDGVCVEAGENRKTHARFGILFIAPIVPSGPDLAKKRMEALCKLVPSKITVDFRVVVQPDPSPPHPRWKVVKPGGKREPVRWSPGVVLLGRALRDDAELKV